ncbi:MAG TPA: hypothetical protein VGL56_11115 [Fimbriimonadaceae bacterium]|jgi:hypothetical protein
MPESNAPRKVQSTSSLRFTYYAIGGLSFVLLLLLAIFGGKDLLQLNALLKDGKVTQGTITFKHTAYNKTTNYYLSYAYNGSFQGQQEVDLSTYVKADVGDPITITYLATNPAIHREGSVSGERVTGQTLDYGAVLLAILAVPFGFLVPTRKEFILQKRILLGGIQTEGQIFEDKISPKGSFHRVRYRFTDNHGVCHDRKAVISGQKGINLKSTMLTVYYVEGKEDKSRIQSELNLAKLI